MNTLNTYKGLITELDANCIFVFGSNTQGRHGRGAALIAKQKFGAIYGQSEGLQGKSYAICTKDLTKSIHPSVPIWDIECQIGILYGFALEHPDLQFYVAYSGQGINLNAYSSLQMASMFSNKNIPTNILFEEEFAKLIINLNTK
jgi:hypothetical protein